MADTDYQRLAAGLQRLELNASPKIIHGLLAYRDLLFKWNRAYNLTSVRDPGQMITRHLLDSLAISPLIPGREVLDVGSGAGLPGIPLALLRPSDRFTLLDGNGKKTRFLFQVKTPLALSNIDVVESRVEQFEPKRRYDAVVCRAFARLSTIVALTRDLLAPGGRIFAMKAASVDEELAELSCEMDSITCHALAVPGLDEDRFLIELGLAKEPLVP